MSFGDFFKGLGEYAEASKKAEDAEKGKGKRSRSSAPSWTKYYSNKYIDKYMPRGDASVQDIFEQWQKSRIQRQKAKDARDAEKGGGPPRWAVEDPEAISWERDMFQQPWTYTGEPGSISAPFIPNYLGGSAPSNFNMGNQDIAPSSSAYGNYSLLPTWSQAAQSTWVPPQRQPNWTWVI